MSDVPTPETIKTLIAIRALLDSLPTEAARIDVIEQLLTNRCRQCFDYDPQGQFWCCYDSRGDW